MPDPTPTLLERPPARTAPPAAGIPPPRGAKPRLKKLRLALVLFGLSLLALTSTVFGMMMAVASDLPVLENRVEYRAARNSVLYDDAGNGRTQIAKLTGNENRILLEEDEISPNIKNAVIAVEDKRFYEHKGVDYRGIARALWQDIRSQETAQGGSTITQQFVKNALSAQGNRSLFQKLRESALAYHLERQWSKQKIITQYLNTVYFGNGAYGIESAVRTYFRGGDPRFDPDAREAIGDPAARAALATNDRAAESVTPAEAALLAGLIASPSAYDPVQSPRAAFERRNLVLKRMLEQELITRADYRQAVRQAIPDETQIDPPKLDSKQPYFSTWVTQQLVDRFNAPRVFGGDLKITTTLDPELQAAAEQAIQGRLAGVGPSASLVAIENRTGEVKAMVGGFDFDTKPFNLATNGHRQPGSAFKPFVLIEALRQGVGPGRAFASHEKVFTVPRTRGREKFVVHNYEDQYAGVTTLAGATIASDNSVYAELGIGLGTRKIARLARGMGVRTKVSTNYAMTLGGLREGLTPLELAFAYSTVANDGRRVSGTLASSELGPVAVERVENPRGKRIAENERETEEVFPEGVARQAKQLLSAVILRGTGKRAQIGEFAAGKTGTTENYGDAWFVGFNNDLTVAVWVGYPDRLKPMRTEYHGQPVAGGTFPAEIWRDFMTAWIRLRDAREAARLRERAEREKDVEAPPAAPPPPAPGAGAAPAAPEAETAPDDEATTERRAPKRPAGAEPRARGRDPAPGRKPRPAPERAPRREPEAPPGGGAPADPG